MVTREGLIEYAKGEAGGFTLGDVIRDLDASLLASQRMIDKLLNEGVIMVLKKLSSGDEIYILK